MLKQQKGITLIALVITIIVLLILAGVSIAMLTGDNGILTQANNAATSTTNAEIKERINMELNAIYADVLAGKVTADFDSAYMAKINTNLAGKATATITGDVITITGGTFTGTVDVATKTITAVK